MQFPTPTSKNDMLKILKDIFVYYRFQPIQYENENLQDLVLPRLEYTEPSQETLTARATLLLSSKHHREIADRKAEILMEISALNDKLVKLQVVANNEIDEITNAYAQLIKKSETEAVKKGVAYSDVVHERIVELEKEKLLKIANLNARLNDDELELEGKISLLESKFSEVEQYFQPIHDLEISAKLDELKEDSGKIYREVFRYNNDLLRRELEYSNTIVQAKASLELKFWEIRSKGWSKDELIDMGYYDAALTCIHEYYSTLSDTEAYEDFKNEPVLLTYLDDYYQDTLYLFRMRSLGQA